MTRPSRPGAAPRRESLARSTVVGSAWAYGSYVSGKALVLIATAILARLLSPEEFGLVALALVFTGLLELVSELGLGSALVVSRDEDLEERAETVFALILAVSLAFTLLVAALGPVAASFFDEPILGLMVPVLGLTLLLRGLGRTHAAIAQRTMDFRVRTITEIADVVVRGTTGIGLALAGAGAWSLVIGYLVGSVTSTVMFWRLVPWRPRLRPCRRHVRSLVTFGGPLSAISLIAALLSTFDYAVIGRVLGSSALGVYTIAFRLPELLVLNFAIVVGEVLFPAYAAVDRASLARAFLVSVRYTAMVTMPLAVGLCLFAEPIIRALFGDQWLGAILPMQVLTLYAIGVAIEIPPGVAYKATGRVGVLLKLAIPRSVLVVGSILLFVDRGIVAVALCQAVVSAIFAVVSTLLAMRLLDAPARAMLSAMVPSTVAAAGMGLVLLAVRSVISDPWPTLLIGGTAGLATYAGLLWLLDRESLRRLRDQAATRAATAT